MAYTDWSGYQMQIHVIAAGCYWNSTGLDETDRQAYQMQIHVIAAGFYWNFTDLDETDRQADTFRVWLYRDPTTAGTPREY